MQKHSYVAWKERLNFSFFIADSSNWITCKGFELEAEVETNVTLAVMLQAATSPVPFL